MKKRRRLITVAALLVLLAVVDFVLLLRLEDDTPLLIRSWRLFLTVLLGTFLAMGKNSARWITVILCGLGALGCFMALAMLLVAGAFGQSPAPILAWLVIAMIAYGTISAFLVFNQGVAREIRRAKES